MPALSHANAAAAVAVVPAIVVAVVVAVVVLAIVVSVSVVVVEALLITLFFFRVYSRGFQDKTARRSVEYLMGRRDSKAC